MDKPYSRNTNVENLPGEEWKEIPGIPPYYLISNLGRLISFRDQAKPIIRKPGKRKYGYLNVALTMWDGNVSGRYVHRLVALAFIPNPGKLPDVDHIDGNPGNNKMENLRWETRADNMKAARERHGGNWLEKYYDKGLQRKPLYRICPTTKEIVRFASVQDAAKSINPISWLVKMGNIGKACKTGRLAHDYAWQWDTGQEPTIPGNIEEAYARFTRKRQDTASANETNQRNRLIQTKS